jgi:hypothetical protein
MTGIDGGNSASHVRRRVRSLGADTAERISAGCYGALVAASTLTGLGGASIGRLVVLVIVTNLTYYATHVFAYTVGDRNTEERNPWGSVLHHLKVSAPMVSVTFAPLIVVLVLTAFGASGNGAVVGGTVAAVLYLVAVATTGAYLRGLRPFAVAVTAAATIAISAALVLTKLSLH